MLRTRAVEVSLWEAVLPPEVLRLPEDFLGAGTGPLSRGFSASTSAGALQVDQDPTSQDRRPVTTLRSEEVWGRPAVSSGRLGRRPTAGEDESGVDMAEVDMAEVELASALDVLRAELELAWRASEPSAIRFRVDAVTLTVQAVARVENKVGGKVRWWLVVGGGRWRPVVFAGADADLGAGVDPAGA